MRRGPRLWVRLVSPLVPTEDREAWVEEWEGELASTGERMTDAWGAFPDAWYLRTEGWTMDSMWRDFRGAVKGFVRRPFFTALAGLTLAIGIGANTAIFSVVDSVLINPLPFPESDRLLSYNHQAPGLGVKVPVIPHSEDLYLHYLERAKAIKEFAVFSDETINLITDGEPQQLDATQVTEGYFRVLGAEPFLGRSLLPGEDRPGAEPVAILGYGVWEESFGSDRSVVGELVEMDGVQRRVVGVMPRDISVSDEDLWVPLVINDADPQAGSLGLIGIARMADGMTLETAQAEMQDLIRQYAEENPDEMGPEVMEEMGFAADVKPLKDLMVQDMRQALWVLLGTVGFVLLIACANVANLFLVRAESRQREQALRTALGASRGDVIRQHLTESVTLALGGGILGLALAHAGVRGLLALAPADLPGVLHIGIDGSVLLFTAFVSVGAGIFFGMFPVLTYGRGGLSNTLREGGRGSTTGRERHRARSIMVVAQVALALVLLVGSGLMLRSFLALRNVDPGFDPAGALTFRFALPGAQYGDAQQVLAFHRELSERLAATPGVQEIGMISGLPLTGSKTAGPLESQDSPMPEGQLGPIVERKSITPGYLEAMRIPLLEGRGLEWGDQADQFRGLVISENLARTFWPNESAIGKRIRQQDSGEFWEVVGVVGNVRFDDVEDEPLPLVYLPVLSGEVEDVTPSLSMDVVIRAGGDPLDVIPGAREALWSVDPRLPMINPRTVASVVEDSMASTSFTALLLGIAAGIALLLGTVGIYGVISYIVTRRTQEIGVRMALGAPAEVVLRSVVGQGMVLTGVGVVVGLLGAFGLSRVLASLLYGVEATDPLTFGGTALILLAVALAATWFPARRASRVDPVEALRVE